MHTISPWQSPALIPEKILFRIFVEHHHETYRNISLHGSLLVSQVCRLWRSIALSHDTLWNYINFKNVNLAYLFLSRTNWTTSLSLRLGESGGPLNNPAVFECVRQHLGHTRTLVICSGDSDEDLPSILQFLVDNPPSTGTLKELCIFADPYCEEEDDSIDEKIPFTPQSDCGDILKPFVQINTLCSVETLVLESVEIPMSSTIYDNLLHLDLTGFLPLVPLVQVLDVCRRSRRLKTLILDNVYEDTVPEGIIPCPQVELTSLRTLKLTSKTFRSTVFLIQHMYTPKVESLSIEVISDWRRGGEFAKLLANFNNARLLDSIRKIRLFGTIDEDSDDDRIGLYAYSSSPRDPHVKVYIGIGHCSWEQQTTSPTLMEYLPKVTRVEQDTSCNITELLRENKVRALHLSGRVQPKILREMRPNGRLYKVKTLEMDCSRFHPAGENGLNALDRCEGLRFLRLFAYDHLTQDDVRCFMEFGIKHGVWIEWAGRHSMESEAGRPPRAERPVIADYYCSDEEVEMAEDSDEESSVFVGSKRKAGDNNVELIEEKDSKRSRYILPTAYEKFSLSSISQSDVSSSAVTTGDGDISADMDVD